MRRSPATCSLSAKVVEGVLEDGSRTQANIGKVLLDGGSTWMKCVPALSEQMTGIKPSRELPDEVVALGGHARVANWRSSWLGRALTCVIDPIEIWSNDIARRDSATAWASMPYNPENNNQMLNWIVLKKNTRVPCSSTEDATPKSRTRPISRPSITQGEGDDPQYVRIIGEADAQHVGWRRPKGTHKPG